MTVTVNDSLTGTGPAETAGLPRVAWPDFLAGFDWRGPKPGRPPTAEHVAAIGPTGSGKTTLVRQILFRRSTVVAFGTKPKDSTLDQFKKLAYINRHGALRPGYRRIESWPPLASDDRVLLWPKVRRLRETNSRLEATFRDALEAIYEEGNTCVYFDELRYICRDLGLTKELQLFWLQGRSNGLSVVAATQRPAFVPVEIYDQSTHLFFWRDNDDANLKRIGGVGSINAKEIRQVVANLPLHDTLYINTRTGGMLVTRAER